MIKETLGKVTKKVVSYQKNAYIRKIISSDFTEDKDNVDSVPESVKLLNAYLTVLGVDLK